jgi:hypothetical protein
MKSLMVISVTLIAVSGICLIRVTLHVSYGVLLSDQAFWFFVKGWLGCLTLGAITGLPLYIGEVYKEFKTKRALKI